MFEKRLIEFSSVYADWILPPVPAKKKIPDWFKKMSNYSGEVLNYQKPTVKKCVPFLDTLTSGYIIQNPMDIIFWSEGEEICWEIPRSINPDMSRGNMNIGIDVHQGYQASKKSYRAGEIALTFKWLNPWFIKTPKNYSCLFTNPFNRESDKLRILDGIVDTDLYTHTQVNFPFVLKAIPKDKSFILEKGHPICLVFPFLRDNWKMKIKKLSQEEFMKKEKSKFNIFSEIYDNYKNFTWRKKNYD